ncbi:hypothetical protein ACFLQQ_03705 [Actinomycetota bacterium]
MKSGQTHLYLIVKDSEITPEKGGQSLIFGGSKALEKSKVMDGINNE